MTSKDKYILSESCVRQVSEQPPPEAVTFDYNIPLTDLSFGDESRVIQQTGDALRSYDPFQVINHKESREVAKLVKTMDSFELAPEETMMLHSDVPSRTMDLLSRFGLQEGPILNSWDDNHRPCPNQSGISLELSLRHEPWTIRIILRKSHIGNNYRLQISKEDAVAHIMPFMDNKSKAAIESKDGMCVIVVDMDTKTEHNNMVFQYLLSMDGYILRGGWIKEFVRRRTLQAGDEVGLRWDICSQKFNFYVVRRADDRDIQASKQVKT